MHMAVLGLLDRRYSFNSIVTYNNYKFLERILINNAQQNKSPTS